MPRPHLMLCGDCLRVMEFDQDLQDDKKPCVCGAFEVSGSPSYERTARLLVKGVRDASTIGIYPWIDLTGWTAGGGLGEGWDKNRPGYAPTAR